MATQPDADSQNYGQNFQKEPIESNMGVPVSPRKKTSSKDISNMSESYDNNSDIMTNHKRGKMRDSGPERRKSLTSQKEEPSESHPVRNNYRFTLNLTSIISNQNTQLVSVDHSKLETVLSKSTDSDEGTPRSTPSSPIVVRSPKTSRKKGTSDSKRIFVWDIVSEKSIALGLDEFATMRMLFLQAKRKFNCEYSFKYAFYKKNRSEILSTEDIRENDELILSPTPIVPKRLSVTYDKGLFDHGNNVGTNFPVQGDEKNLKDRLSRSTSSNNLLNNGTKDNLSNSLPHYSNANGSMNLTSCSPSNNVLPSARGFMKKINAPNESKSLKKSKSTSDLLHSLNVIEYDRHHRRYTFADTSNSREWSPDEDYDEISQNEDDTGSNNVVLFDLGNEGIIDPVLIPDDEFLLIADTSFQDDMKDIDIDEENLEVRSGTLKALILRLTTQVLDQEFIESFLLTYDLFIDHVNLLNSFVFIFRSPGNYEDLAHSDGESLTPRQSGEHVSQLTKSERKQFVIQYRISKIISHWIGLRFSTLRVNETFVDIYNRFAEYIQSKPNEKLKRIGQQMIKDWKDARNARQTSKKILQVTKPTRVKNFDKDTIAHPLLIPIDVLAQQLTLMEQSIFGRTQLSEYFNLNFTKHQNTKAKSIGLMIKRFNKISFWIASSIISRRTAASSKQRGRLIEYFIELMETLMQMSNYNSMLQVFSALNMMSICRLTKSWSHVSVKHMNMLRDTAKLFVHNYKGYRNLLYTTEPPCIPIQEVILRDLTYIEESPSILENNWINFEKMHLLGKTYKIIKKFQGHHYNFVSNNRIYEWILSYDTMSSEELLKESFVIEPTDEYKIKIKEEKKKEKRLAKEKKREDSRKSTHLRYSSGEESPRREEMRIDDTILNFQKDVRKLWYSLDFEDKEEQNTRKIAEHASILFVKYISTTSKKQIKFESESIKKLKENLKNPKTLPKSLFDDLLEESKLYLEQNKS